MEIKKIEKSDLVLFPRLQEQGVEPRHVEREAFRAELRHVDGHGDYWLLHQQAKPHVVVNIQFAADEAELAGYNQEEVPSRFPDNIKSIVYALSDSARWWHEYGMEVMKSDKK